MLKPTSRMAAGNSGGARRGCAAGGRSRPADRRALSRGCVRGPPRVVVTCGRGSSAHAATFAKHLFERYLGIPVAAAAPSIASIYGQHLHLEDQLCLVVSQSGESDDLIAVAQSAKASGALTVADRQRAGLAAYRRVRRCPADRRRTGAERRCHQELCRDLVSFAEADCRVDRRPGARAPPWRGCPIAWPPPQPSTGAPHSQRSAPPTTW